jgi:hypothetical protein
LQSLDPYFAPLRSAKLQIHANILRKSLAPLALSAECAAGFALVLLVAPEFIPHRIYSGAGLATSQNSGLCKILPHPAPFYVFLEYISFAKENKAITTIKEF